MNTKVIVLLCVLSQNIVYVSATSFFGKDVDKFSQFNKVLKSLEKTPYDQPSLQARTILKEVFTICKAKDFEFSGCISSEKEMECMSKSIVFLLKYYYTVCRQGNRVVSEMYKRIFNYIRHTAGLDDVLLYSYFNSLVTKKMDALKWFKKTFCIALTISNSLIFASRGKIDSVLEEVNDIISRYYADATLFFEQGTWDLVMNAYRQSWEALHSNRNFLQHISGKDTEKNSIEQKINTFLYDLVRKQCTNECPLKVFPIVGFNNNIMYIDDKRLENKEGEQCIQSSFLSAKNTFDKGQPRKPIIQQVRVPEIVYKYSPPLYSFSDFSKMWNKPSYTPVILPSYTSAGYSCIAQTPVGPPSYNTPVGLRNLFKI